MSEQTREREDTPAGTELTDGNAPGPEEVGELDPGPTAEGQGSRKDPQPGA